MTSHYKLLGPFRQIICLSELPLKGAIRDDQLDVFHNASVILKDDRIFKIGKHEDLLAVAKNNSAEIVEYTGNYICLPSFIDCHTHICFAGSRARDYAMRNAGSSYLEIAKAGGGIWDTVQHTRKASIDELVEGMIGRLDELNHQGITTVEVKSGYGLSVEDELKMLRAIRTAKNKTNTDLVSTCLAAHIKAKDFDGDHKQYLEYISENLFPVIKEEALCSRMDAFIEEEAFTNDIVRPYFTKAKQMGFELTVHADQFSPGGSHLAVEMDAISADHLEASTDTEINMLANSNVIATALPGASIGLGCAFTPARKLLDAGACVAIASDWNPGSAPMGNLVVQASIMASFEKLSNAEVLAGITYRAAAALGLSDRGRIKEDHKADLAIYELDNYNEIFYHQGMIRPVEVWKSAQKIV